MGDEDVQPGLPQQVESNMYLLDASALSAASSPGKLHAAAVPGGSDRMRMGEDVQLSVDLHLLTWM